MAKLAYHFEKELERHASKPLRDAIFFIVKNAIIEGFLLPGDRVTEEDLARRFNCSRTPVREALRKLEQEGMLIVKPGIGMEIAPINFDLLEQEFEIRKVLEEFAVTKACETITEDELRQLEWSSEKLANAIQQKNFLEATHLNMEFHEFIYTISNNHFVRKFTNSLWLSLRISFLSVVGDVGRFDPKWFEDRLIEHKQLIEAFRNKDKVSAVKTILKHIHESYIYQLSSRNKEK